MSTTVVDPERVEDEFSALWLQVGYHMVGALGHRFADEFKTIDRRLGKVEHGQAVLTERVDGLTERMDKVEVRLENLEHGQVEIRDRLDRLENATLRGFNRIEATLDSLRGLILRSERNAPPPPPVPRPGKG